MYSGTGRGMAVGGVSRRFLLLFSSIFRTPLPELSPGSRSQPSRARVAQ